MNNRIRIARGGNASIADSTFKLAKGQPIYNTDDNYIYVSKNDVTVAKDLKPVDTYRIIGYTKNIDANGNYTHSNRTSSEYAYKFGGTDTHATIIGKEGITLYEGSNSNPIVEFKKEKTEFYEPLGSFTMAGGSAIYGHLKLTGIIDANDFSAKYINGVLYIRTQEDFDELIESPDWLGAKSVCFVGNGGLTSFRKIGGRIIIPSTVHEIRGEDTATISVEDHENAEYRSGAFGYAEVNYANSIKDITLKVTSPLESDTEWSMPRGFFRCTNLIGCRCFIDYKQGGSDDVIGSHIHNYFECHNMLNCSGDYRLVGNGSSDPYKTTYNSLLCDCTKVENISIENVFNSDKARIRSFANEDVVPLAETSDKSFTLEQDPYDFKMLSFIASNALSSAFPNELTWCTTIPVDTLQVGGDTVRSICIMTSEGNVKFELSGPHSEDVTVTCPSKIKSFFVYGIY